MSDLEHPYTRLTPEKVLDAIESIGIRTDARIFPLNSYENRVYQIGVENSDPVIAKFYRPGRWTKPQILEEHGFARELFDLEIPVVPPDCYLENQTLLEFDGFQFAVFSRLQGRAPELDNMDNLLVMGRFIARVHAVGARTNFKTRKTLSIDDFSTSSREFLLNNDFIPTDLIPAYDTLSRDLIEKMQSMTANHEKIKIIRVHGDCHPGNILWRDDTPWFVDFDDTLMAPAMQDLWMLMSGNRDQRQAQLLELVEGYNEFYDFNTMELELIEVLRTMRIMYYSCWLARRWQDPTFPKNFPWFNTERYWAEHILELREQLAALNEPPLQLLNF